MDAGALIHRLGLTNPGTEPGVPDGDGGYIVARVALSPATVWASIQPATARNLERVVGGTVLATATHVVTIRYHPQVTTKTQCTFGSRILNVTGVQNEDEANVALVLACAEVVP